MGGGDRRDVVFAWARDRGRALVVDHRQGSDVQAPFNQILLDPPLSIDISDQNPVTGQVTRQRLHPRAEGQAPDHAVLKPRPAADVDAQLNLHPVDIGRRGRRLLCAAETQAVTRDDERDNRQRQAHSA